MLSLDRMGAKSHHPNCSQFKILVMPWSSDPAEIEKLRSNPPTSRYREQPAIARKTSDKPTSGESARFHWSDYRLVARDNFRVARQPGPKLEGHAFGRAKRNCQDRSRDIQRCAPNQLVGVSGM